MLDDSSWQRRSQCCCEDPAEYRHFVAEARSNSIKRPFAIQSTARTISWFWLSCVTIGAHISRVRRLNGESLYSMLLRSGPFAADGDRLLAAFPGLRARKRIVILAQLVLTVSTHPEFQVPLVLLQALAQHGKLKSARYAG